MPPLLEQVISLSVALLSIFLAGFSLWLSLYFYRRSNELSNLMMQTLQQLVVSARTTEVTTTQVTNRALDVLAGHFEQRVEEAERDSRVRVAESVAGALAKAPPRERYEAQAAATRAVSEAFLKLRTSVAPASGEYDWGPFIRRIHALQRKHAYLSVKWLHRTVFAEEPGMQEALQIALEQEILRSFRRANPKRPQYPTLCCELNPAHPVVAWALGRLPEVEEP